MARLNGDLEVRDHQDLTLLATLHADAETCTHLASHPSMPVVVSCGFEGMLRFWDVDKKALIHEKLLRQRIAGLRFSEDGEILMVATYQLEFLIYSLEQFQPNRATPCESKSDARDPKRVLENIGIGAETGPCPSRDEVDSRYSMKDWIGVAHGAEQNLRAAPYDAYWWSLLGKALNNLSAFEAAAEAFRIAITLDPDDMSNLANRGLALYQLGKLREARNCLDEYLRREPLNRRALDLARRVRQELADQDAASE
jgi:tetratricopeptide (TPR) repeat protein